MLTAGRCSPPYHFTGHRHREETRTSNFGGNKITLPAQLSEYDFHSLAEAIQCIAQSTVPLDQYINGVGSDMETMIKERNHWKKDEEDEHRCNYLGPLQEKLKLLDVKVQKQVNAIKSLETSVKKNDNVLKQHGVVHSY